MKAIVGLQARAKGMALGAMEAEVESGYPFTGADLRFPFSVELRANGQITSGFEFPKAEVELLGPGEANRYVQLMMLVAIQRQLRLHGAD